MQNIVFFSILWLLNGINQFNRLWEKKRVKVVPGFWILNDGTKVLGKVSQHEHLPEGAMLDNMAWDHEHCELCWTTSAFRL